MKRSDRAYAASPRYKKGNRKQGSRGYLWLILVVLAVGCWYYFTQYKPDSGSALPSESEIQDSEAVSEGIMDAISETAAEPETTFRPEGKEVPVETIYRIAKGTIETSKGNYTLAEEPQICLKTGVIEWENLNSLVGLEDVSLYLDEKEQVESIYIDRMMLAPDRVRILLAAADGGYIYETPEITCSGEYWVTYEETIETYTAEDVYTPQGEIPNGSRIVLKGATEDTVWSVSDGSFRGSLELVKVEAGWYIVNMLYLEPYLYSVVPSEMPDSHGVEAAKVQAVCSRSFAYTQWKNSTTYAEYGAHMDNTVNCQVYGHILETRNSVQGVEETRGQLLIHEGEVVVANFFSTSCGMTADAGDVWANAKTQEFPTSTPSYLIGRPQGIPEKYGNLSEESAFYAFITDEEVISYDDESPWYRWETVISVDGLLEAMMPVIKEISSMRPYMVQTLNGEFFETRPVDSIGNLKNVYVYSRAESGLITELLIEGTKGTLKISGENSIRRILAAGGVEVELQDGTIRDNQKMIPSAFFSIEKGVSSDGNLLQLTLKGGGYGHGVGMSQMGVKGMLNSGITWDEILKHYYNGIEIGFVPV